LNDKLVEFVIIIQECLPVHDVYLMTVTLFLMIAIPVYID